METYTTDFDDWMVVDDQGNDVTDQADDSYESMMEAFEQSVSIAIVIIDSSGGNCVPPSGGGVFVV